MRQTKLANVTLLWWNSSHGLQWCGAGAGSTVKVLLDTSRLVLVELMGMRRTNPACPRPADSVGGTIGFFLVAERDGWQSELAPHCGPALVQTIDQIRCM